ncbi:MAG: acetylxylan esterase, partial [Lentisphaerota bacterium]
MKIPNVWTESFTDYINNQLKTEAARLVRTYQLEADLESWQKKRIELRKQIWKCLGTGVDHSLALDYREYGTIKMDGYSIKKITYQSRLGFHVIGNLYVPDGKGPFPAVINMHGHWSQGRLAERVQERGHSLAKNGYVCLAVDAFGSGERSISHGVFEYHGSNLGASLMNIGETLMGMQVVDNMRGVDLLCSMDYVDKGRIGATGASGGGNQTMWLTAMDDRIAAAMPVVSVGSFQSYVTGVNCVCELLPAGLTFTEESGVLALTAPRALKICNCLQESNPTFFPSEMLRSYKDARKIYQAYDSDDKISYQV